MRQFGHVGCRNNDDIIKKMDEIKVERNRERDRLKKKWMEVIKKDIKACRVDDVYGDRER